MNDYPFVGNAATDIVHDKTKRKDACRVSEIKPENREYFKTLEQATTLKRGTRKPYRACKKCVG